MLFPKKQVLFPENQIFVELHKKTGKIKRYFNNKHP